jgi:phosphoglycerol transferase MdoB-like AlkP superfamily enzyme
MKNSKNNLSMKSRFFCIIASFFFWLGMMIIAKIAFLIYHANLSSQLSMKDLAGIFIHGIRLDMSVTGYIMVLPVLIAILTSFTKGKLFTNLISMYTLVILILFVILTIADMELYKYWGTRLDNIALRFIDKPKEMIASTSWVTLGIMLTSLIIIVTLIFVFYQRIIIRHYKCSDKPGLKGALVFILLLGFLFIPIRGSFGIAPIGLTSAYFHKDPFPNHAALNTMWNVGHSMLNKKDQPNPFKYMDDKTALKYVHKLFTTDTLPARLLTMPRPNIIMLILESYTAKLIEPLGGLPGVTPSFNSLCKEGIFFTNFYANDSRTDKSIVSILSGYPALGKISIIKFPDKTQRLWNISRQVAQNGYHTAFYYGGDPEFASISSYLINGQFQQIISLDDFPKVSVKGRWGVHDQVTFQRLFEDCSSSEEPFFKVLLTLSNHEPFDIPVKPKFGNKTIDEKVCSSAHYTDSCIGDFINRAKSTGWWKNTLIIMQADHGIKFPGNTIVYHPDKYRIPMLWLGGAIKTDTIISSYCSQSDLAKTLLNQLEINASDYYLSKDIFMTKYNFAFYEFNNGFGMVSDSGRYVYDNDLKKNILEEGKVSDFFIQAGKAVQQVVYNVYLNN